MKDIKLNDCMDKIFLKKSFYEVERSLVVLNGQLPISLLNGKDLLGCGFRA